MPTEQRIELAHGISEALKRFRGRGIDVEAMLTRDDYARDILQQCRVSGNAELQALADRFGGASPAAASRARIQSLRTASPPSAPPGSSARHNPSWLAPLDVFSRRSGMPRG